MRRPARRRSGLAQTQLLILGAVIAAVIVLSVGGFAVYRSVTRGAEDNAAKTNIDRVLTAAEDYWQQYALNRDGTRDISYPELCDYMNSQFTVEDDLILRSAAVVRGTSNGAYHGLGTNATVERSAPVHVAQKGAIDSRRAFCDVDVGTGKEIVVGQNGTGRLDVQFHPAAASAPSRQMSAWQDPALKLGSTRGIFMMPAQKFDKSTGTSSGWGLGQPGVPPGTDPATEAFVVGVVGSSGNTFCAVKIFDADDRSDVGNYRYALSPDADGPRIPQPCREGIPRDDRGEAGSGWKAAS